ncbi:MAG: chromosome segregation protein SMC [Lachnospiraceae bacterium]|nr:chromosome segregation protein SMC [Lachnospiraceae bacterium]
MYLKSIEVQGFKSFANRIVFEFHNGITGIVGPNGSGKSNVADAVRWVLGEQSAKSLRGSKMEDVIFAGTEIRKPVSYAYVSITLDNSDRALNIDHDEVTVTRKVFRSGESEYLINGNSSRLKEINELFYDTGIGKEGYSIIGQGQIDRILSGKPDERRELFDEAAGIVKFKRRKAAAVKKLDTEENNLVRIKDILAELEKQVGPLEKQSEKAKQYLELKENLKHYDANHFLLEVSRLKEQLKDCEGKYELASTELQKKQEENESIREEYEKLEGEMEKITTSMEEYASKANEMNLVKGRLEGQINVITEQIHTLLVTDENLKERIALLEKNVASKDQEKESLAQSHNQVGDELRAAKEAKEKAEDELAALELKLRNLNDAVETHKNAIIASLNHKSETQARSQRYETMLEQMGIRKSQLNSQILKGRTDEALVQEEVDRYQKELDDILVRVDSLNQTNQDLVEEIASTRSKVQEKTAEGNRLNNQYHAEKSKLESLKNLTERYEGYGNSIRHVMDQKEKNPGILGVVADIIKVESKYEIAIETALGGTIQNVVTNNEDTAKGLITYLKENKFGRATFLPLNAISGKNTLEKDPCMQEEGVVGVASNLVKVSFEYVDLARYLLGRILVVDHIDHALAIARKYRHSLRIVTLEGEQLNPGGSMTGGAFKNNSNLLGRRREIEELQASVKKISKEADANAEEVRTLRALVGELRTNLEENNTAIREAAVSKTQAEMNLKNAMNKKNEIIASYKDSSEEASQLDEQLNELRSNVENISKELSDLDVEAKDASDAVKSAQDQITQTTKERDEAAKVAEEMRLSFAAISQRDEFVAQNVARIEEEKASLVAEMEDLSSRMGQSSLEVEEKRGEIETYHLNIADCEKEYLRCNEEAQKLRVIKEEQQKTHKEFFDRREALSKTLSDLDKEVFRLSSQMDKLNETHDNLYEYMWNEYEMTMSEANAYRDELLTDVDAIKKQCNNLRSQIKSLGDVNVNAIEEYKDVHERYTQLKTQHDDLIAAAEDLKKIIEELDTGMRAQFSEKFEEIKREFDKVFKELFGGGKGTIELIEGEDILEAGINIISQPPGKKLQNMMQLSGGEKALTAISLLFAIQNLKPSPFCLLDEIEAALDDSNVTRYAQYLHKLTEHTQFIVITHRRGTMAAADRLYGITMQEKGVSTLVSVDLIEKDLAEEEAKRKAKSSTGVD